MKNLFFLLLAVCYVNITTAQIASEFEALNNSDPQIQLRSNNSAEVNAIGTSNDGDFVIYSNGSDESLRIEDNTGYIGINNPVPSRELDVTGSANISSFLFSNRLRVGGNADGNAWATGVIGDGIYREGKLWITPKQNPSTVTDAGLTLTNFDETSNWTLVNSTLSTVAFFDFYLNADLIGYIRGDDGSYVALSDINLKKNIEPMTSVLANVKKLEPSKYHYKRNNDSMEKTIGFMAQDTQPLFPELVSIEEGRMGINYAGFSVVAIKAIQEQQVIIEQLQDELAEIKTMISQR